MNRSDWMPRLRWFAAEYLIVGLGVLTAVGANSWWTDRATAARAEQFTARLTEDVRYEAWAYDYLMAYYGDVLAAAEVAVGALSGDTSIPDEAFLVGAYRATQLKYNERQRATYDELISTREIGLIADETLRAAAVAVFTIPLIDVIRNEGIQSEYRRVFRRLVPADVQRELLRSCGDRIIEPGDYEGIVGSLAYPCTLGSPPAHVAAAASALRSDPDVLPALQLRFADVETTVTDLANHVPIMLGNLRIIAGRGR
jgi:hypothetical protein